MADLEDVTLDGRALDSLRVTDLRAALEERGLAKSGQKSALMKRLKGALMLENLQKHSTPHTGYQPNSQMGEEMGQNSFIKQYLEKQQELLRQRLQREAREVTETEEHSTESEDEVAHTDLVPEPADFLRSGLKMPETEVTKRTPKKCQAVLGETEDSEEERPKKRERRSSRVKQSKVPQSPVFVEPAQEQEPRRTRARRSKGDATPSKEPEEVGADDEEIEEDKEIKLVREEEETPKRRRSTRANTPQQHKKSPVVKRSPSPPELTETKTAAVAAERASEERVPPLLSFEGIKQQISTEKPVSSVSVKASPRKTPHSESSRAQRSSQKWGRQLRDKEDEGLEQPVNQLSDSSLVIRQTASWHKGVEKQKSNLQDLSKSSENDGIAVNIIGGASSKDVKARSLVLMRPPVRAKPEGKTVSGEQSLHIIEKSSGRGVQTMSILEKKDPESNLQKDKVSKISVCTEDVQEKQMPVPDVDGTSETEKSQVISPSSLTGTTKMRKLKIRTSLGSNDPVDSNIAVPAQELTIKSKPGKPAKQVYRRTPEVATPKRLHGLSKLKKVKLGPHEEIETPLQNTDVKMTSPVEVLDLKKKMTIGSDTVMDSSALVENTGVSCVSVQEIFEVKTPISIQSLPDRRTKEDIVSLDKLKEEQPSVLTVSPSEGQTFMEIEKATELKSEAKDSSIIMETQTLLMSEKNRDVQELKSEAKDSSIIMETQTLLMSEKNRDVQELKSEAKDSSIIMETQTLLMSEKNRDVQELKSEAKDSSIIMETQTLLMSEKNRDVQELKSEAKDSSIIMETQTLLMSEKNRDVQELKSEAKDSSIIMETQTLLMSEKNRDVQELKSEAKDSSIIMETQTLRMSEKNRDVQQNAQLMTCDHMTPESVKQSFPNMTSGNILLLPQKEANTIDKTESTMLDKSATLQENQNTVLNSPAFESPCREPVSMGKDLETLLVVQEEPELLSLEKKSLVTAKESLLPVTAGIITLLQSALEEDKPPVMDIESNNASLPSQTTPELASPGNERIVVCESPDTTESIENVPITATTPESSTPHDCIMVDIAEDPVAVKKTIETLASSDVSVSQEPVVLNKPIETVASGDVLPVIHKASIPAAANEEQNCLADKEILISEKNADAEKCTELERTTLDVVEVGKIEEDSVDLQKPSEVLVPVLHETDPEPAHFTESEEQSPSALQGVSLVHEKMDITITVHKASEETEEKSDVASQECSAVEGSDVSGDMQVLSGPGLSNQTTVSEMEHISLVDQKPSFPEPLQKDLLLEETAICTANLGKDSKDSEMLDLEISTDLQESAKLGVSEEKTPSAVEYISLIKTDTPLYTPKGAEIGEHSANLEDISETLVSPNITEEQNCSQVPMESITSNTQESQGTELTATVQETLELEKSQQCCTDLQGECSSILVSKEITTLTTPNVSQVNEETHIPVVAQKISEEKAEECSSDLKEQSEMLDLVVPTVEHEPAQHTVSAEKTTSVAQDISLINLETDSQVSPQEVSEFNNIKECSVVLKEHSETSLKVEMDQQGPTELLVSEERTVSTVQESPKVIPETHMPEIEASEFGNVTECQVDVEKPDEILGPEHSTDQEESGQLALSEEERAVSAIQAITETIDFPIDFSVTAESISEFGNAKNEHDSNIDIDSTRSGGLQLSESPTTVQDTTLAIRRTDTTAILHPEHMEFQNAEKSCSSDVQELSESLASEILTISQPPSESVIEEGATSSVQEHCEFAKAEPIVNLLSEELISVDVQKPIVVENEPSEPEISAENASVKETYSLDREEPTDISGHHDTTLRSEEEQENLVTIAGLAGDIMNESLTPKDVIAHDKEFPIIDDFATVMEEECTPNVKLLEKESEGPVSPFIETSTVCEEFKEISRSHEETEALVVRDHGIEKSFPDQHSKTHGSIVSTVTPIIVESLAVEEQEEARVEELQKEEEDIDDVVREYSRRRSSSSSSTSSTSSSASYSRSSRSSSSSRSRRSSYSKSSSEKRKRKSRSSSSSSSSSRSSSSHSDKVTSCRQSPPHLDYVDTQTPTIPATSFMKTTSPHSVASPPHPSNVVHLHRSTPSRWDSTSLPDRTERRRVPEDLKEPDEQDQAKRIRLEPKPEVEDQKSQVSEEEEEGQYHEDSNVVPENDDVVMEPAENQTEGEPQEAAPPQPSDDSCEADDKKESTTTQRPFKRKISVISATKSTGQAQPASTTNSDNEGAHPARRRRWGSSTATTQKKPSISISTESLKSLIPEIKEIKQDAVVDLHAEDTHISEDEVERNGDDNSHDKGLKICRTVTQVVPAEVQENGQEPEEEEEATIAEEVTIVETDTVPTETEVAPTSEQEVKKPPLESPARAEVRVTLGDTLLRRSISQQKTGVSITIDDPVRTASQQPSPPRRKPSCIVHICNLVRPFTLGQLKELLARTGTLVEENFWIDKIKSHCYTTYSTLEEAVATRNSLHGVKWPQSNPKFLSVDFAEQDELDFHRGLLVARPPEPKVEESHHSHAPHAHVPTSRSEHREHERGVREQWAEREREMERRERTRSEREWDRDKIREGPRSRSRDRRRKEHAKSKEKKNEKKEKVQEEPPAKLLDDLFHKTKAVPCIYWLPLSEEQIMRKDADRVEREKEREKRRKEQEERQERAKEREKETERNRERARDAEREKKREHSRERLRERERREPKRHSRSRSRSTPVRDRGGRR
uniref:Apoptotic chromatin condensation inducer 1 n=1 Tax=Leptobrachium leishanense TaxID=445787 RepID=A0A8C5MH09_9ANUR